MLRASMPSVRMAAMFMAALSMLVAMIAFPSTASAQTGPIDVRG